MGPPKLSSLDNIRKSPIYAVIIGIDCYASPSKPDLYGATKDADRFENYLTHDLGVPTDNVVSLRDEKASRKEIIHSIRLLKDRPGIRKDEAAIIIYFAGHGGRTKKMICPSDIDIDISSGKGETTPVEGISGGLLAELLAELSEAIGDNITIFLDCCYSTGMIHPGTTIRRRVGTENEYHSSHVPAIFVKDWEQYTVITASERDMKASERISSQSGFFTSRLLEVLRAPKCQYLTYMSLMHQLEGMPSQQIPHCEGSRLHRLLFSDGRALTGDPSFVLTRRSSNGLITLFAGSSQGIVEGDRLSVHGNMLSDLGVNPSLGTLVVTSAKEFSSTLHAGSNGDLPEVLASLFYCKLTDTFMGRREKTVLYSPDSNWLESIFSPDIQSQLSLNITGNAKNYDLRLEVLNGRVHFWQSTKLITTSVDPHMRETVDKDDILTIRGVVERFIHFYSNLVRSSSHKLGDVGIELDELTEQSQNIFIPSNTKTLGDHSIIDIGASETQTYGLTVLNRGKVKLYPYLYCFDPMDLTITELYHPPTAAGEYGITNKADSPLLPSSILTIGYGSDSAHGSRFGFYLLPGQREAIAYLRLYLSSSPASFESMVRETSPFDDVRERAVFTEKHVGASLKDEWMVKTMTLIFR